MTEIPDECFLDNDGGPEVHAIEGRDSQGHRQSLHIRVGPVFQGNGQAAEPGIWVEYQEEHMKSLLSGPVLLDIATWRRLNEAVEYRLQKKNFRNWCRKSFITLRSCRRIQL
jgi:hypothetical protein